MVSTVNEIVPWIKQATDEYEQWARDGDIRAHRPCPVDGCSCQFRHRHGWVVRTVWCGGWERRIRLLRLLCPECRKTETLIPEWLLPGSPYPWPWQEAAVWHFVGGPAGYRPVAAVFGVDYTLLWGWTRRVAVVAVDLVRVVVRELLRQEPGVKLHLMPAAYGAVLHKARTPERRQGLAHVPLLTQMAEALRAACHRRAGLPEGETSPGVLGWLGRYLALHGGPPLRRSKSHTGSHSMPDPAPT
jgi:hypothetical protein